MMRVHAVILAVAATLALAGCSSQPNSPVDPETTSAADYEVPLLLLGIAVIVGVVLLAINLSNVNRGGSPPPAPTPVEAWQQADEGEALSTEETPGPRKSTRATPSASKPKRRRAP